ncbi:nicotinate phosphoribosyltransferase [Amycolatopsis lexingtonensis]|uniref:Nicotinate phosphoribosyltransferase n=1 Tax=Amycolatopsis lexingtonensis TaxID=218822 RepID=A0ABR9HT10_9PSEU|nr:nicotinate phosphoribosyltransferase [Amycolatopsis lexingtonensis]MBE1494025.1 nicotinate phosphoribosyltransferase [Amycolatopsis lexingtonensis]
MSWAGGLHTDLYEIRMAASYLRRGMTGPATFSLFVRRLPPDRGFLVSAGLDECLDFLERFRFTGPDLAYLRDVTGLPAADLAALGRIRFTGDVHAVPEGRVVFPGEPLLEVTAPLPEAQLVETALLNFTTYAGAIAAKAVRCRIAAPGADLVDFAARRTHGPDAAFATARATAVAGFTGTSHVASARRFGLRAVGTMAHSYIEAFPSEYEAFRAFAEDFPGSAVFLVDTYDTLGGVRTAIAVARELRLPDSAVGVRLDSGDLGGLAVAARGLLDRAGLPRARIMASGGLDEFALARLTGAGAPIEAFGIGTKVGVSADAPFLDSAYKLVAYDGRPVLKLSAGKVSSPGAKQVFRGAPDEPDVIALRGELCPPGREPLLVPVMRAGRRLVADDVHAARRRLADDLDRLPAAALRLTGPEPRAVHRSSALRRLTNDLVHRTEAAAASAMQVR